MEYTKGEWTYTEELRARFSMVSGDGKVICGMVNPWLGFRELQQEYDQELEEMRANAHIIKAAPAMYQALKDIFDFLKHSGYRTDIVKQAIAKAEGKE